MFFKSSISVFVPALNEQENLENAVNNIREVLEDCFHDWEILIFNDGSHDSTGEIADNLSQEDHRIRVFHHKSPNNIGGCYKKAIFRAEKEYFTLFPGDNENDSRSMRKIFQKIGTADMIIPFPSNPEVRPWLRRVLSRFFVMIINLISGFKIRYYNGTVVHRTPLLRTCNIMTDGFGYQAEILTQILRRGFTYHEVGIRIFPRPKRRFRALNPANFLNITRFLGSFFRSFYRPFSPFLIRSHDKNGLRGPIDVTQG